MADSIKDITELLPKVERGSGRSDGVWFEVGVVVGAATLIVLGFMVWARFFRRGRRHRSRKSLQIMGQVDAVAGEREERASRRHRQRDRYTRRNPTLAETGGLPPVRHDADDPPSIPPASQLPS
jgi:hypothetical protein